MTAVPLDQTKAWLATPAGVGAHLDGLIWPRHLRLVSALLVYVAAGRIRRLSVSMPPGHGKSTAISRTFPIWLLELWPYWRIILATYGAELAVEHGKAVRERIERHGDDLAVRLKADSQAANRWQTEQDGGMWTAGTGSAITGRRAQLILVDDPHKDFEEAHSKRQRDDVFDWWQSTARTRLVPGGFAAVLATRWHEDDLIGRLHAQDPGRWVHVKLPAIADGDEDLATVLGVDSYERLTKAGIVLPAWSRKAGEALWPTTIDPHTGEEVPYYDEAELAETRAEVGEYLWQGLYQAEPSSPEGSFFPIARWKYVDEAPRDVQLVRWWDLAASTSDTADETVGALVARDARGFAYVIDVEHGRYAAHEAEQLIRVTAQRDWQRFRGRVKTYVEKEPGASGKAWAEQLVRETLAGFPAQVGEPAGTKDVRATPFASQQQAGNVFIVRAATLDGSYVLPRWHEAFVDQHRMFPDGPYDDIVDATSSAYNQLARVRKSRARARSVAGRQLAPT